MPLFFIIYIIVIVAVGVGIYWLVDVLPKRRKKSASPFNPGPTYRGGGAEEIATITDDDLPHAVFMWALPDESDYAIALREVMGSNPGKRALYLVGTLDCEVLNGGLNQYFFNKGTILVAETARSLRHIGEAKRAEILERALAAFSTVEPRHQQARARGQRTGNVEDLLQAFSETYQGNPLSDLDHEYDRVEPEVDDSLVAYIRAHPDEFRD